MKQLGDSALDKTTDDFTFAVRRQTKSVFRDSENKVSVQRDERDFKNTHTKKKTKRFWINLFMVECSQCASVNFVWTRISLVRVSQWELLLYSSQLKRGKWIQFYYVIWKRKRSNWINIYSLYWTVLTDKLHCICAVIRSETRLFTQKGSFCTWIVY